MAISAGRPELLGRFEFGRTVRTFAIAVIALAMAFPLAIVEGLIAEREYRYQDVLREIGDLWGGRQSLIGPVLVIPVDERTKVVTRSESRSAWIEEEEKEVVQRRHAIVLPDVLSIDATIAHETRHRAIYDTVVYATDATLTGSFAVPDEAALTTGKPNTTVQWRQAFLVLGLGDSSAIQAVSDAQIDGRPLSLESGTRLGSLVRDGFHAPLAIDGPSAVPLGFSFALDLRGSERFAFAPLGRTTTADIEADWPHPSFDGAYLPVAHEIDGDGFAARWEIPHLARALPQYWLQGSAEGEDIMSIERFSSGVRLYQPVDLYQLTTRAAKYGMLFVGLTLLCFFILECATGRRLHLIQYGVVAGALVLFFLLLLSLAEHIGFAAAYLVAALAKIAVIALYARAILEEWRQAAVVGVVLTGLYALLYFILRSQDHALLAGALTLFLALIGTMLATRRLREKPASRIVDEAPGGPA